MKSLTKYQWKLIILSGLGGMLEFYDFVVFAVFAYIIGQNFFPSNNPILSVMAAFTAFAVGYIVRPLGGIVFSHFGDKHGRKHTFIISISVMGIATLGMGLVPSYHTYGITMSIIFVLLRILQGMALGGEIPGAITFVTEHIITKPGFSCGVTFFLITLGILLADLLHLLLSSFLTAHEMLAYGWRAAFIFGGILAIVSYFMRKKLNETPEFIKMKNNTFKIPFLGLIKSNVKNIFTGSIIIAVLATLISILYLYMISYMKLTGLYSNIQIIRFTLTGLLFLSLSTGFWGILSDYIGHKNTMLSGMILLILTVSWFFSSLINHTQVFFSYIVISIISGMITGTVGAILFKMFPAKVKYSGIAISYNLGFAIFGGLTPLIATYLIHHFNNMFAPAYIIICITIIGTLDIFFSCRRLN